MARATPQGRFSIKVGLAITSVSNAILMLWHKKERRQKRMSEEFKNGWRSALNAVTDVISKMRLQDVDDPNRTVEGILDGLRQVIDSLPIDSAQ